MKKLNKTICYTTLIGLLLLNSCNDILDVPPDSEFSDKFLSTSAGIFAVLNSAYDNGHYSSDPGNRRILIEEAPTDVVLVFRGSLNRSVQIFHDFVWSADHPYFEDYLWQKPYRAIRDANILLSVVDDHRQLTAAEKTQVAAEAQFIRALSYSLLYGWFGPVPLIKQPFDSPDDDFSKKRADEGELLAFIEEEFIACVEGLPLETDQTGKATKGAALGALTKFYMKTKNWTKAAATAKQVMDLGVYDLWPDYTTLFALENEGNYEMIFVFPNIALVGEGNTWNTNALPPQYPAPLLATATQVTMPLEYYNTFAPNDKRKELILTGYISTQGETINLLEGVEYKNPRSFKYPMDPNADGREHGGDFTFIRYADILLCRAEALVMASGTVTQEALDLFNKIRIRAGVDEYTMEDIPDQQTFIDLIIQERGWEFYSEGKRREDLIRQNMFLQNAIDRGKNAQPFHVRYPLPQSEIDANPNLEQNPEY